jgi:hypothetical protein
MLPSIEEASEMTTTTSIAIIAIVAALALLGVVIVDSILTASVQVASAASPPTKGCRNSQAFNASQGNCFHGLR